jgi:outer membrane biosynthesis protein TonB
MIVFKESFTQRLFFGFVSIGLYILVVLTLLYFFAFKEEKKEQHFVEKNENKVVFAEAIAVNIVTPPTVEKKTKPHLEKPKLEVKKSLKPEVKLEPKPKIEKKTIEPSSKGVKKPVTKEKPKKIEQKPKPKPKPKPKKKKEKKPTPKKRTQTAKSLFDSVKTETQKVQKQQAKPKRLKLPPKDAKGESASTLVKENAKAKRAKERGIENAYFAKVKRKLNYWSAHSEHKGSPIYVKLVIQESGSFSYTIRTLSDNRLFNSAFIAYLKQLQRIGFNTHSAGRAYVIGVKVETH